MRRAEVLRRCRFREHRDTTFVAVVDEDRNTIAFINSIFDDFGCGIVSPRSGVIFHNRAGGFVLDARASERHRSDASGRSTPSSRPC